MKLVSVIIPTHNRSDSILRALDSVLSQTHTALEIVVVDDNGLGSPEQLKTRAALKRFIHDGSVLYLAHEKNQGANAARNSGIKHSSGEYVAFLDDDDEWMSEKIERQLSVMEADKEIGVIYTRVRIQYDDLGLGYATRPRLRGYIHKELLLENYVGAMASVLIRRAALIENPLDESLPARQDYDLWLRISRKWKFEILDRTLAIVHARNTSTRITANFHRYLDAVNMIQQKYASELSKLPARAQVKREAEQTYFLGSQAIKANRPDLARALFVKSLRARFSMKSSLALVTSLFGAKATIYARFLESKLVR